jgi:hypothetical protein
MKPRATFQAGVIDGDVAFLRGIEGHPRQTHFIGPVQRTSRVMNVAYDDTGPILIETENTIYKRRDA